MKTFLVSVLLLPLICTSQSKTNIPAVTNLNSTVMEFSTRVGESFGDGTNNIFIGYNAGRNSTNSNCILIGRFTKATRDNELVIKFTDGTELRQLLPPGKTVDHGLNNQ